MRYFRAYLVTFLWALKDLQIEEGRRKRQGELVRRVRQTEVVGGALNQRLGKKKQD